MAFEDYLAQRLANRYGQVADEISRVGTTVFNPAAPRTPDYGLPEYGAPANVTPKSTTITYNADGTQTITNKEEVAPGQPGMMPQPTAMPQPAMMQTQAPAPTQMPPQIFSDIRGQEQDLVGMRQPTAPVAPMPMQPQAQVTPAPAAPVAPGQMAPEPQPQPVQTQAPAATTPPVTTAPAPAATMGTTPYADRLSTAVATQTQNPQQSLKDLQSLIYDPETPTDIRQAALQNFADISTYNQNMRKAEAQFNEMIADPNGMLKIDREIKRAKDDGSYLKAYIYSRLGLNELSVNEQRKLGAGQIWQPAMLDGKNVSVKYDQDGLPVDGFDAEGKALNNKQLARIGVMAAPRAQAYSASAEVYTTPDGKQQVRQRFNSYNGRTEWVDIKTGIPWSGEGTPTPQRVLTQAQIDWNKKYIDFNTNPNIAAATEILKFAVDAYGVNSPEVQRTRKDIQEKLGPQALNQIISGIPAITTTPAQGQPQPAPATTTPPATPAAPVAPTAPVAPAPQARPISMTEPAPSVSQAVYRPGAEPQPQMIQTQAAAGTGMKPMPGESPMAFRQRMEIAKAAAEREAATVGEDIGKVKSNLGQIKDNADYLTTKIDELVNHPGFKFNVGVADVMGGIPIPFGATVAGIIPGTETADWQARFDEIKGQQFLQGIQQLKGTGAITDREGAAAEKAISRMRTSQSEKEFRAAADDFQDIIKRGVDRSLRKAGQEPIYGTEPASKKKDSQPGTKNNPIKL